MGMPVIYPGCITRETAVGAIIGSVAMEEAALAHILNAESEKILAAVEIDGVTPEELIAVNRSVESTLQAIIRLELLLKAKLDLFGDVICCS